MSTLTSSAYVQRNYSPPPSILPLTRLANGDLALNITVLMNGNDRDVEDHFVRITFSWRPSQFRVEDVFRFSFSSLEPSIIRLGTPIERESSLSTLSFRETPQLIEYDPDRIGSIAVGYGSAFLNNFGSFSIIRVRENDNAQLIVRSTLEQFVESCRPETIITSLILNGVIPMTLRMEGTDILESGVRAALSIAKNFITVPRSVFDGIVGILTSRGLTLLPTDLDHLETEFSQCTREMVLNATSPLPRINIEMGHLAIGLWPDEYLQFNESTGRCQLRIAQSGYYDDAPYSISPQIIPGINFRLSLTTGGTVNFCESVLTD
jgi:hypothetical protein